MAGGFDPRRFEREFRAAQRKAAAQWQREANREINRVNRENKRIVEAHNRKVAQHNKRVVDDYNRKANAHNRKAEAHNKRVIDDLNRQLRVASVGPRYTQPEETLADRVRHALPGRDDREWDSFLSYARIDGSEVGAELRDHLESFGASVWFDEISIRPGQSQSRQMDLGLQKARAGIVLLTPAYIAGRFWTERELGALLGKETLIPVLHNVTFEDVRQYSGILPDLAGFETARDSVEIIAQKIAAALLGDNSDEARSAA
ncbi:MAG TPA: toll/interleukin-1 receptor domain-containing protein [Solirubrobacterales bacterium]|nr:toll/interleukin-1 receptor domain-containing protein [Solirubrobacterales bacterium]